MLNKSLTLTSSVEDTSRILPMQLFKSIEMAVIVSLSPSIVTVIATSSNKSIIFDISKSSSETLPKPERLFSIADLISSSLSPRILSKSSLASTV